MEHFDFVAGAARARRMTDAGLLYAITDCRKAAEAIGEHAVGKDASYYRDEASVYHQELNSRRNHGTR